MLRDQASKLLKFHLKMESLHKVLFPRWVILQFKPNIVSTVLASPLFFQWCRCTYSGLQLWYMHRFFGRNWKLDTLMPKIFFVTGAIQFRIVREGKIRPSKSCTPIWTSRYAWTLSLVCYDRFVPLLCR